MSQPIKQEQTNDGSEDIRSIEGIEMTLETIRDGNAQENEDNSMNVLLEVP
jgi:hypothetical protein